MLTRDLAKLVGGILLTAVAALVVLPGCTSPPSTAPTQPASPPAPPAAAPTAPLSGNVAPANPQTGTNPADAASNELLAKGKVIFEKTAGGVGCAYCHGLDGKGAGPSGLSAPPNRGKSEAQVRNALATVEVMSFLKLKDDEIPAVVAYLKYLGEQP